MILVCSPLFAPLTRQGEVLSVIVEKWCGDPIIPIAHAVKEVGWNLEARGNNLWGIKAHKRWRGKRFLASDGEWFCWYDSLESALTDYGETTEAVYPSARKNQHKPERYFKYLTNGNKKWCPEVGYDKDCMVIYRRIKRGRMLLEITPST